MASGSFQGSTSNARLIVQINWSSTPSIENNSSVVTATLYAVRTDSARTYGTGSWAISIGGNAANVSKYVEVRSSWVTIITHTATIPHDADGTKSIYINAWGGISGTTWSSTSIGATVALDTIPRASGVSLSTAKPLLGSTLTIDIDRKSEAFTHDVTYSIADQTGTIAQDAATQAQWELPLSLASKFPADKEKSGTITVTTKRDGTAIGTSTAEFTAVVPETDETRPKIESLTLEPVGSPSGDLSTLYIQNMSQLKATFTASSNYSGNLAYSIKAGTISASGNPAQTGKLTQSGQITVTATVTDARGFSASREETITVHAYSPPRVAPYTGNAIVCVRCNAQGVETLDGIYLLIQCRRSYSKIEAGGANKNLCRLEYRAKTQTGQEFPSVWTTLLSGDASSDLVNTTLSDVVPQAGIGYTIQIRASDSAGNSSVVTIPVAAAAFPFHLGEGGTCAAFGQYCDYSLQNTVQFGWAARFAAGLSLRKIYEGTWNEGEDIAQKDASADLTGLSHFTLFLIVLSTGVPVLGVRSGTKIYAAASVPAGGIVTDCIRITIANDGSCVLNSAAGANITAFYAIA